MKIIYVLSQKMIFSFHSEGMEVIQYTQESVATLFLFFTTKSQKKMANTFYKLGKTRFIPAKTTTTFSISS